MSWLRNLFSSKKRNALPPKIAERAAEGEQFGEHWRPKMADCCTNHKVFLQEFELFVLTERERLGVECDNRVYDVQSRYKAKKLALAREMYNIKQKNQLLVEELKEAVGHANTIVSDSVNIVANNIDKVKDSLDTDVEIKNLDKSFQVIKEIVSENVKNYRAEMRICEDEKIEMSNRIELMAKKHFRKKQEHRENMEHCEQEHHKLQVLHHHCVEDMEAKIKEARDLEKTVKQLKKQIAACLKENESILRELHDKKPDSAEERANVDELKRQLAERVEELKRATQYYYQCESQKTELAERIKKLESELARKSNVPAETEEELLKEFNKLKENYREKLKKKKVKIDGMKEQLAKSNVKDVKEMEAEYRQVIANLKKQLYDEKNKNISA